MLENATALSIAPLSFIMAFAPEFGVVTAPVESTKSNCVRPITSGTSALLGGCLTLLDPDIIYNDWFRVAAVIFNVNGDAADGYAMFDAWSSNGKKYKGQRDTSALWGRLKPDFEPRANMGTLIRLVQTAGYSMADIWSAAEPFDDIGAVDA
jgi:hypothetical protein